MERKSLEEIASKKRAEYRRRFELLDAITLSVKAHFLYWRYNFLKFNDKFNKFHI